MKRVGAWLRDYFAFSRTETRGTVLLLLLTGSVITASTVLSARTNSLLHTDEDWQTLDSLVTWLDQASSAPIASTSAHVALFPFDPNNADSATLTQLGLKPWIAQRVLRYREKGGAFRRKADFKKIYGLPEETYLRLYDFIQLPENYIAAKKSVVPRQPERTTTSSEPTGLTKKEVRVLSVDINTADTTLLKKLPGIGSKLSARIVKYRQLLGGYHTMSQLQEIYHMTDLGVASLQKSAYIAEENHLHILNINTSDAKTFAQHPYISWELARALVAHRQDYGEYRALDDLLEVYLMTEKVFEKIAPYLEI